MPTDAPSPPLDLPRRSEQTMREIAARERRRRLEHHGVGFCRAILDGAFERVYRPDGSYRLRAARTGAWLEDPRNTGTP